MKRTGVSAVTAGVIESPTVDVPTPVRIPISFDELVGRMQATLLPRGLWCHPVERPEGGYGVLEVELRDGGRVYLMRDFVARARALGCLDESESPQLPWASS
jgi:hypothetical protein